MENSNRSKSGNLYKCPYQSQVYGTDNSDLIYRKGYTGDWGHWDDQPDNVAADPFSCETDKIDDSEDTARIRNAETE